MKARNIFQKEYKTSAMKVSLRQNDSLVAKDLLRYAFRSSCAFCDLIHQMIISWKRFDIAPQALAEFASQTLLCKHQPHAFKHKHNFYAAITT